MATLRIAVRRHRFPSTLPRSLISAGLYHPYTTPRFPSNRCYSTSKDTTGATAGGGSDYRLGPANELQPQPQTQRWGLEEDQDVVAVVGGGKGGSGGGGGGGSGRDGKGPKEEKQHPEGKKWKAAAWKVFESAATTTASLAILGFAGYGYHKYYKRLVLDKVNNAFNPGDPALNVATAAKSEHEWVMLDQQPKIDAIIRGDDRGRYYLLIGEKGTGKTSMILSAMHKIKGHSCSIMEAHADPEVFRIRLGKALDFEYHEDYIGSLFSIRGPRDTTALLDIERALNTLEKVAIKRRREANKPLIMIINSMHLLRNNENGNDVLELLQQRAEAWAASGLVTMVFNSDDYWVYERMKQYGSRMELVSVCDLPKQKALGALKRYRNKYHQEHPTPEVLEKVYKLVGGRLAFLNRVAKSTDMLAKCEEICEEEKQWLLNKCGLLGEAMDDDVMDQQKFASSAMCLVKELVEMEKKMENDPEASHQLPKLPLDKARAVMTRADFIEMYDRLNIFTIDSKANVKADSVPMQNAFRKVVNEPGFAEYLDQTLQRIGDIESLGRTRELTIKDLWYGGKYNLAVKNHKGHLEKTVSFDVTYGDRESEKDDKDDKEKE
ncbi:hypothetical protein RUND412_005244 [Rhizina undulata]